MNRAPNRPSRSSMQASPGAPGGELASPRTPRVPPLGSLLRWDLGSSDRREEGRELRARIGRFRADHPAVAARDAEGRREAETAPRVLRGEEWIEELFAGPLRKPGPRVADAQGGVESLARVGST